MVFHWSLSDSKSPQVSRTLLSIPVVRNNVVVWMVSTRPLHSKSSSPFSNPFVNVLKAPVTFGIIVAFMSHSFFNFVARSRYLSFLIPWSGVQQNPQFCKFSFFIVDYYKVWCSGQDYVIHLYVRVLYEFVCVILQERYCIVNIPFVRMVKFKFLVHLPVNHLAHPAVSSFLLLPC